MKDRLFLSAGCPDCAIIKGELNFDLILEDELNKDGRQLFVFSAASDEATRDMLIHYGLSDKFVPVYLTDEGKIIDDVVDIIRYIQGNRFSRGSVDD